MSRVSTTRLSSKGWVVIPAEIRVRLGLETGPRFVVFTEGDMVRLKVLEPPVVTEFDELIARARSAAKRVGLRRSDVAKAITKVRASG